MTNAHLLNAHLPSVRTTLLASTLIRAMIEPRLPEWIEPLWFASKEEALALAPRAEIGWFDMYDKDAMAETMRAATGLRWLNSIYAGLDGMPLDLLHARGCVVTNGKGINAITIAEYVVMGMLTIAKGWREVVHAQDRHEWLLDSPGKIELAGSRALLIGYGAIGQLIETRLAAFDVAVDVVRRTPGPGQLGAEQWRAKLGDYDWVILALPATDASTGMIGAGELAAMKPTAQIINIARGSIIDTPALIAALDAKAIGGAFLDVTEPEPLPADHALWDYPTVHISMHLSGRAQDKMFARSAERFLDNLARWGRGEPVAPQMDLLAGY